MKLEKHVKRIVECPRCKTRTIYDHLQYFNSQEDIKEIAELMSGRFSFIQCNHCGALIEDTGLLYEDPAKNVIIFYDDEVNFQTRFFITPFQFDKYYTVTNFQEFFNCVFSINHNLNWWTVKLCIASMLCNFFERCKEKNFKKLDLERCILFEKDGSIQLYTSLAYEDYAIAQILTIDLYKKVQEKYMKKATEIIMDFYYLSDKNAFNIVCEG